MAVPDEAFVDVVKGLRKAIRDFRSEVVEQEERSSVQEISYIGKQIDKYVLVQEIGNGTYGRVYWATDRSLPSRSVAIKVMKPVYRDIPSKREHFLQESRILRPLKHPYILPIIDAGLYEGLPYIVTEFAPNGSLRERLNRLSPGGFLLEEALAILSQAGQALDYAHQHDVIDRDLKPENILFTASDKVLLADFGLALVSSTFENEGLDLAGTLQYMAPEQFAGHAEKASDQYALGCIAYELLTGRTPFPRGGFASMWFKHAQSTPPPLTHYAPHVPSHIERAVLKALAKKPGERFADISAFLNASYKDKEQPPKETRSAPGGSGMRRLPVYFLLDCSESMTGDPIVALNEGIQMIHRDLMSDPQALETVWISIITFANQADQYQFLPLDQFLPPVLSVGGAKKALGAAFRILVTSIEQDLIRNTPTQHGDYRPVVFLLTDGSPTDHYHYDLQRLHSLRGSIKPTIVALGCGGSVDVEVLHEITENVFLMHTISPIVIRNFFQWISGSIAQASRPPISSMEPPTSVPAITYSPN